MKSNIGKFAVNFNWRKISKRLNDPYLEKRIGVPRDMVWRTDLYKMSIDKDTLFYIQDHGLDGEPLCEDFNLSIDDVLEYDSRMLGWYQKLRIHESEPLIIVFLSYCETLALFLSDVIGKGWNESWFNYGSYLIIILLFLFQSKIFDFLYGRYVVRKIKKMEIPSIEKYLDCHYMWAYTKYDDSGNIDDESFSSYEVLDL